MSSNWEPLSVHSFRYLVLAYRGNGLVASDFVKFASVLEPPIHFSCHCRTTIEFGYGERRSHGHMPLHNRKLFQPDVIASPLSHASLEKIRVDWTAYQEVRALFPILEKALGMLFDLNMIPRHHDLYLLGLFAIVELLLTHNPQNKENADSINHQISTKMPLLSQRMERKPHYQLFGSFSTGSVAKLRTVPR